eukprot:5786103-Pyramimonas_sp.AAC.2
MTVQNANTALMHNARYALNLRQASGRGHTLQQFARCATLRGGGGRSEGSTPSLTTKFVLPDVAPVSHHVVLLHSDCSGTSNLIMPLGGLQTTTARHIHVDQGEAKDPTQQPRPREPSS